MACLRIERLVVRAQHVEAVLVVEDRAFAKTTPESARRALAVLPTLARHSCSNETARRFIDELGDTETAHLLEHVAVELMSLSGSPRNLRAETSWDFSVDGAGVYRVRVAYDVDLVAIAALNEAAALTEWIVTGEGPAPEIEQVASRVAAVRN